MTSVSRWQPGDSVHIGGRQYTLGAMVGAGAEAAVWTLRPPSPPWVVKLYDQPDEHREHARLLLPALQAKGCLTNKNLAAPFGMVFRDRAFAGVVSPHLNSPWASLNSLVNSRASNLEYRLVIARHLASTVSFVHRRDFTIGDLNPANLLWHPGDRKIAVIDVDSWGYQTVRPKADIRDSSPQQAVPVVKAALSKAEFLPPRPDLTTTSQDSDRFALALLIMLVLTGAHPYGPMRRGDDTVGVEERIGLGHCWLLDPGAFRLPVKWFPTGHPGIRFLPPRLAELFEEAHRNRAGAGQQPTAADWIGELGEAGVESCLACSKLKLASGTCPSCSSKRPPIPVVTTLSPARPKLPSATPRPQPSAPTRPRTAAEIVAAARAREQPKIPTSSAGSAPVPAPARVPATAAAPGPASPATAPADETRGNRLLMVIVVIVVAAVLLAVIML